MALPRTGYSVLEMWECEWDQLVDTNEGVKHFLSSFDLVAPLQPREAIFGGGLVRWLCMLWLGRGRKYATWMSPPFTRG